MLLFACVFSLLTSRFHFAQNFPLDLDFTPNKNMKIAKSLIATNFGLLRRLYWDFSGDFANFTSIHVVIACVVLDVTHLQLI